MTRPHALRRRSLLAITALGISPLVALGSTVAPASAAPTSVDGASFVWGISGYAQKGIFGPWAIADFTGDASGLVGSVSGGTQTEYVVDPVPATSMPSNTGEQKTANAVKFVGGSGTVDAETGAVTLAWDGSYVINAYPPQFGAPDETFADPELTVAADGSGELTMEFSLGAGTDMLGNPIPAEEFGRLPIATFSAGSLSDQTDNGYRITPDYLDVEVTIPEGGAAQTRACSTDGGATGWWGSWPQEFVENVPSSVRPHYYSTACAGLQDNKPPLPLDVTYGEVPTVEVSDTTLLPNGDNLITVTGSGFDPSLATGTRPPLSGKPGGAYIAFGRFADVWQPSTGAASSTRPVASDASTTPPTRALKWAVLAEDMATIGGPSAGAIELTPAGTFTTTLVVDKADADAVAASGNYGIYTYPGSGAVTPSYETFTPITFAKVDAGLSIAAPARVALGAGADVTVTTNPEDPAEATGDILLKDGATTVGSAALVDGVAEFSLPRSLAVGAHGLTAEYAGNDNVDAATATKTLTVRKGATTSRVTKLKKPRVRQAGSVSVRVTDTAPGFAPAGKVRITVTNAKGKAIQTVTRTINGQGRATVVLKKRAKGKYAVQVSYLGNSTFDASRTKKTFRV